MYSLAWNYLLDISSLFLISNKKYFEKMFYIVRKICRTLYNNWDIFPRNAISIKQQMTPKESFKIMYEIISGSLSICFFLTIFYCLTPGLRKNNGHQSQKVTLINHYIMQ